MTGTIIDPIDGVTRIVSYRHLDGYPLAVMVGLSQTEEFADYYHTRNVYLLMTSFITLAMLAFFGVATGLIGKLLGREREMTQLAEYDLLTGLANRYATLRGLRNDVSMPASLSRLGLLFIDLDNFKTVNDTLGHNAGDIVLQMTASRLSDAVGDEGSLARIGGDEFVVVMKGDDVERRAVRLAEAIIRMFGEPFDVRGSSFVLHASIGIALHTVANESEIDLLKKADLAMYSAKDAGKNCYQFYAPHLSHRADHLMRWEQQLRVALAEGQLFLAYQPKIDLTHRHITGFEALARWDHPEHGVISANEFISIAESTGLIVPIGDFVIRTACEQIARWRDEGHDTLTLAVNISPVQFWRGDLIETISQALQDTGIDANRLEIEITETAMMEYPGRVREDRRAEEARHPHRARRFRHRLFVAVVPAPLLRRHAEGRPLVRAGDPERSQRVRDGVVDRASRALARPDRRRRRHGNRGADHVARRARRDRGARFPVLATGAGRCDSALIARFGVRGDAPNVIAHRATGSTGA